MIATRHLKQINIPLTMQSTFVQYLSGIYKAQLWSKSISSPDSCQFPVDCMVFLICTCQISIKSKGFVFNFDKSLIVWAYLVDLHYQLSQARTRGTPLQSWSNHEMVHICSSSFHEIYSQNKPEKHGFPMVNMYLIKTHL